jgi:hypothetical protein
VFIACGYTPSRTPLGGDYTLPAVASAGPRKQHVDAPSSVDEATATSDDVPVKLAHVVPSAVTADAGVATDGVETLHYEPFRAGDQIRADVTLSFSAEIQGGPPELFNKDSKMRLDAKLHVDLKVLKSSAQSLDELEVTLTPVSVHTDFAGQTSDSKQDPPDTYDVTLSGQAPNIRSQSGTPLEPEDRATLTVLITPLVEFHNHWARSPSLALKPGWSSKVPLTAPAFMAAPGDTVHVGPLAVRYPGRDASAVGVPFELSLPIEYGTDLGKLNLDFSGKAVVGTAKGRPLSIEMNGPLSGTGGPNGAQFGLRGSAKFAAALSYP